LKSIFNLFFRFWFQIVLRVNSIFIKKKYVYFIDIDNTLADTYPSYFLKYKSEADRIKNLPVHINMVRIFLRNFKPEKRKFIYISSRSYLQYFNTIQWLNKAGLKAGINNTILVQNPTEKIALIHKYFSSSKTILVDDMSYNHEHGTVKFYADDIAKALSLKIKFFGHEIINKINKTH
jgi:hypothetical protein